MVQSVTETVCSCRDAVVTVLADSAVVGHGVRLRGGTILTVASGVYGAKSIVVQMSNISSSDKPEPATRLLLAVVVALDLAANIAFLELQSPPLETTKLAWGKSRSVAPGESVVALSAISGKLAAIVTTLADNRSLVAGVAGEFLVVAQPLTIGAPILTSDGLLLGLVTVVSDGISYALSEFFLRRPTRTCLRSIGVELSGSSGVGAVSIRDGIVYYVKSSLLLEAVLATALDLLTANGVTRYNEVVGYKIVVSSIPELQVGDIVTHLQNCPLGDKKGQISPTLVMWRVNPGAEVTIRYRRLVESYATDYSLSAIAQPYPAEWDVPTVGDTTRI